MKFPPAPVMMTILFARSCPILCLHGGLLSWPPWTAATSRLICVTTLSSSLLPSAGDVDLGDLLDKPPHRCQSDTAGAACDDGDLALQSGHCLLSFPQSRPGDGPRRLAGMSKSCVRPH